ncbi:MAG: hypothetical protein ABL921_35845, partial [Pirellula sp.]
SSIESLATEVQSVGILNANKEPSPFRLGIHKPIPQPNGLAWNISLQRSDGEVPQRPAYVWGEIEPLKQETDGNKADCIYAIANGCWQSQTTLPMLAFDTQNWPRGSSKALLRFWCTDSVPTKITEIGLAQVLHREHRFIPQFGTIAAKRIRYQVCMESESLVFVLMHENADEVFDVVPQIVGIEGFEVQRQYSKSRRMSIHRFKIGECEVSRLSIELLSSADLRRNGLQLISPVEVNVVPEIAALPSTPPPAFRR